MAKSPKKKQVTKKVVKAKTKRKCVNPNTEEYIQQLFNLNDLQRSVLGNLKNSLMKKK